MYIFVSNKQAIEELPRVDIRSGICEKLGLGQGQGQGQGQSQVQVQGQILG